MVLRRGRSERKKRCEIDQSITVLPEDEMPDLIEDDYRITVAKYEALNKDTKQRVNNAIQYDKSLGKTFTYWKKGLDVIRKNPIKNADIKDAEALKKHITSRKSR
jgi:hypothetical protein